MSETKPQHEFWANILSKYGISGVMVLFVVILILGFASNDQKQQIIDTYILFKPPEGDCTVYFKVVLLLIIGIIIEAIFWHRTVNLKKERIEDLTRDKTDLYDKLFENQ